MDDLKEFDAGCPCCVTITKAQFAALQDAHRRYRSALIDTLALLEWRTTVDDPVAVARDMVKIALNKSREP